MPLAAGTRIGAYEISAPLGKGGMGEVYRARDAKLDREVAIKVLPPAFANNAERLARFQREAKVLASLNHPNIATVYALEDTEHGKALVMELVEGSTAKGPLPLDKALKIALQVADAIEVAHEEGIVHRDIKPSNVMVTAQGNVKVLDFGLASVLRSRTEGGGEDSPTLSLTMTEPGVILGTAAYMSPEQAGGENVDRHADIWSFGVLLTELLTGERLFQGPTVAKVLANVINQPVDLAKLPAETPPPIRDLIQRCLEREVRDRLHAMGEARITIQRWLASPVLVAPKTVAARRPTLAYAAVGVLGLACIGLGYVAFGRPPAAALKVTRFQINAPEGALLPLGTPAISPDGSTIAYTVTEADGKTRIHVRPMDRVETRSLPGTEDALHPFWSPDGKSLAFATPGSRRLKRIDLAGGAPRDIAETGGPWHGDWSAKGGILFTQTGVSQIFPERGEAVKVGDASHPSWLPDGERFLARDTSGIVLAAAGKKPELVLPTTGSAPLLAETPSGKAYLLYLRESDLVAQAFDLSSGKVRGEQFLLVPEIGVVANPPVKPTVGVSRSGILAYQTGGAQNAYGPLTWLDRSGRVTGTLPQEASGIAPSISPDGSSVAITRLGRKASYWVVDLGRRSAALVSDGAANSAWAPDSKHLMLTVVEPSSATSALLADVGNPSQPQRVDSIGKAFTGALSSDGKWAVVRKDGEGMLDFFSLSDRKSFPITQDNTVSVRNVHFSPDGRYIAFDSTQSTNREVYVQSVPPGNRQWKISTKGGDRPRWRRDGRELYYLTSENAMMAVDITPGPAFSAGIPHELFPSRPAARRWTVMPTSGRLAFCSPSS